MSGPNPQWRTVWDNLRAAGVPGYENINDVPEDASCEEYECLPMLGASDAAWMPDGRIVFFVSTSFSAPADMSSEPIPDNLLVMTTRPDGEGLNLIWEAPREIRQSYPHNWSARWARSDAFIFHATSDSYDNETGDPITPRRVVLYVDSNGTEDLSELLIQGVRWGGWYWTNLLPGP